MHLTHLLTRQIQQGEWVNEQRLDKSMDESKHQWTSNAFDSPVDLPKSSGRMGERATSGQVNRQVKFQWKSNPIDLPLDLLKSFGKWISQWTSQTPMGVKSNWLAHWLATLIEGRWVNDWTTSNDWTSQWTSQSLDGRQIDLTRLLTCRFHVIGPNGPNRPMDQGPGRGPPSFQAAECSRNVSWICLTCP